VIASEVFIGVTCALNFSHETHAVYGCLLRNVKTYCENGRDHQNIKQNKLSGAFYRLRGMISGAISLMKSPGGPGENVAHVHFLSTPASP
jgi:hypothetical protein